MEEHPWTYVPARNKRLEQACYEVAGQACFMTIRAAKNCAPFTSSEFARIAEHCLLDQRAKSHCQVDVYCIMPDHVHVVLSPMSDGASCLRFVDRFKGWSSRELHRAGWRGTVWQPRSYDHIVRSAEELALFGTYILANPQRSGLIGSFETYRWAGIPQPLVEELALHWPSFKLRCCTIK